MASFNIVAAGTTAGVVQVAAATACLLGKTLGNATFTLEASKDGVIFAPITTPMAAKGVTPIAVPAGWTLRVVTVGGVTIDAQVEVA